MPVSPPRLVILAVAPEAWDSLIQSLREITEVDVARTAEQAGLLLPGAEIAVLVSHTGPWLAKSWERAPNLRWVQSSSTGVEDVLFPALRESSVVVTNTRGAYAPPLAEFVMLCVLFFAKNFPVMERNRRERRWDVYPVEEIRGQTISIVGLGETGSAVARLAKAMDMRVVAVRRRPNGAPQEANVDEILPAQNLHELLAISDYVVNTLPLTPLTRSLFEERCFHAMKPTSCFINVGRGSTVSEKALIRALQQGWIRGAGLDVFETEPLPAESELYSLPNVILSPHCADQTTHSPRRVTEIIVENVRRYVRGEPLRNVVDKDAGY